MTRTSRCRASWDGPTNCWSTAESSINSSRRKTATLSASARWIIPCTLSTGKPSGSQYGGSGAEVPLTLWCGPDDPTNQARWLYHPWFFHKGDPILCFEETTGDHLFVDRLTYNFRHPRRGEIIVFKTKGIAGLVNQDQFYIKRLIGLPGDTVSIGDDRHVRIDGLRLDSGTPHFANVYAFDPKKEPEDSHYSGHVLDSRSQLRTTDQSITVPSRSFVVFGDNTVNSLDSRYWGALSEQNVIGKSFFIYWPITDRFGWGQQ